MNEELNPNVIVSDDLKFDGKNIVIPRYWIDNLCEYIKNHDPDKELEADKEDFILFRNFLYTVVNPLVCYFVFDDLKFDGKNIVVPSYWIDNLCEYIKNHDPDKEDFILFRNFLWSVQEYRNQGN